MFCSKCGREAKVKSNFCSNCGTELCGNSEEGPSTSFGKTTLDYSTQGVPKGLHPTGRNIKSFADYRKAKGKQWKKSVSTKNPDKDKPNTKSKERDVCINIGLLEWNSKDNVLKPKRGKKLVLRVSNKANYKTVCSKAILKWKAFYSHLYSESDEYVMLYENGEEAIFLPGSAKEFFSLERYQQELGKDYNRITLFLCTSLDYNISKGLNDSDEDNAIFNCDMPGVLSAKSESPDFQPNAKFPKLDSNTEQNDKENNELQIENDERLAIQLQQRFEDELEDDKNNEASSIPIVHVEDCKEDGIDHTIHVVHEIDKCDETKEEFTNEASVIQHLEKQTDNENQFFLVIRRKVPFHRALLLWQREAKKSSPMRKLTVKYIGEDGIDTGALAREFLTDAIDNMRSIMFPNGCPFDSTYHIQNGNFRTCGQIAAVSLAQGGPSPSLFDECVYETLVNPDIDMMKLSTDKHLAKSEKVLIEGIISDVKGNETTIMDNGYTGLINDAHVDEIVKSIVINLINKRILYLNEFLQGLSLYGFDKILRKAPDKVKSLFVQGSTQDDIDANYLFSCMEPVYSEEGTSRRVQEEKVVDNFQDFLMSIEDTEVTGYSAPVAWNYQDKDEEQVISDVLPEERFETAEVNVPGVMKWLTGQKHKPLSGKKLVISVLFDHDCQSRDPKHTICYPLIGACGMQITFPICPYGGCSRIS
ncbi:uncharacterized protein LOC114535677 [Dendronephthya gigantea]|uniref:uncharacterized protein LOC114535677 n=1 Tax=Dendronephthya gigantea TaxID=151771 RepID=UPI00106C8338|nr:uncharacterized protein LOC114535677 [Dendronephthya gigantea]